MDDLKIIGVTEADSGCLLCNPAGTTDAAGINEELVERFIDIQGMRVPVVSTGLTLRDRLGAFKSRMSSYRMDYRVPPGLYATGKPDENSDVFVSASYKLSFDVLRSSLKGFNSWILVLDTKGINVWCAAGKDAFGTDELILRIKKAGLKRIVNHRRIIVPQLGAPGIRASLVRKESEFRVSYGHVRA